MRVLTAFALLLALSPAGADDTRLQVTATILSRCQFDSSQAQVVARCTGAGAALPYRITRAGRVLTIEF